MAKQVDGELSLGEGANVNRKSLMGNQNPVVSASSGGY